MLSGMKCSFPKGRTSKFKRYFTFHILKCFLTVSSIILMILHREKILIIKFEAKINAVFDNLTHLVHPNLVKFHKWWTDTKSDKPRVSLMYGYLLFLDII